MYAMMFFMWPGIALELGSWWALLPAAVIVIAFVIRTALEDRTRKTSFGYAYAQRVLSARARLCKVDRPG
jgi:protein-S-isoprenylcysteine O-methyltransferase Ste14